MKQDFEKGKYWNQDYDTISYSFPRIWNEYIESRNWLQEKIKPEIEKMIEALEKDGFTRKEATIKILVDHCKLKGFSKKHIPRAKKRDSKK